MKFKLVFPSENKIGILPQNGDLLRATILYSKAMMIYNSGIFNTLELRHVYLIPCILLNFLFTLNLDWIFLTDMSLKIFEENSNLAIVEDEKNNNELALLVLARKSSAIGGRNTFNIWKKCINNHC